MGKNKGDCDVRQMVESLDQTPYGEMPKWGQTAVSHQYKSNT